MPSHRPGRCQEEGCSQRAFDACHQYGSEYFTHEYLRKGSYSRTNKLCKSCAAGEHAGAKTRGFGCVEHITQEGFVCSCPACTEAMKRPPELWRADQEIGGSDGERNR